MPDPTPADHPDGPWRSIPAAPESREPAAVAAAEATGQPRPLSPAALKVLDAVTAELDWDARYHSHSAAAATLRAAADQVVPEAANEVGDEHDEARLDQWLRIRWKILAIAAELENNAN